MSSLFYMQPPFSSSYRQSRSFEHAQDASAVVKPHDLHVSLRRRSDYLGMLVIGCHGLRKSS